MPGYTYLYSNAGRLSTVKQGSTTKGTYAYDASGLRRRKVASGVTTIYHFDEAGHLLAETNTSGVMQRLYVWADDVPVAQKVSSTLTYLHADHLDTPRWGTSTGGALVWRWRSDGFGEAAPEQDPDGNGTQVSANLRFPGQYYDAESGLHQNWMRDYTPGYGRYAQADPIGLGGGVNLYLYAGAQPTRYSDPSGEQVSEAVGAWIGADLTVPDPSDAAWPKWAAYGAALGGASVVDWMILENAANKRRGGWVCTVT